jgi:phenylacetate-CoA ligase
MGRSDNMVKIKGINVFPQAIGTILRDEPDFAGDYVCILSKTAWGEDKLRVCIESHNPGDETRPGLYRARLKSALGIELEVELSPVHALARLTEVDVRQKPVRLIDERKE